MGQREKILEFLRENPRGITPLEALNHPEIRSFRLGARIEELRKEGYDIETVMEKLPNGKRVARYVLHEKKEQLSFA